MMIVTGGAGFVGHHLVRRLLADGHGVIVVDNLSTGRRDNLAGCDVDLRVADTTEPATWADLPPVHTVFHLASPASPRAYQADPMATIAANVDGTRLALHFCGTTGARLLFTSTSEVYGSPSVHPQPESYWGHVNPRGPRACYDESKRLAETLCWVHEQQHGTAVRVARLFNTFGPGMAEADGRLVPTLLAQARAGRALTVHGDGSQTRSFAWVHDIVDGLVRLAASGVQGPVNLGNPDERTVLDVAQQIGALHGGLPIVHTPRPTDDPHRRCPDVTRASTLLGWRAETPLEVGLARLVES